MTPRNVSSLLWSRLGKGLSYPPKATQIPRVFDDRDKDLYGTRHLVENFFARLKQYRAITTSYDKRAVYFLGPFILLALSFGSIDDMP
jgi:transposase